MCIRDSDITEWYSTQEIQKKFGMTLSAIYTFVSKNEMCIRDRNISTTTKSYVAVSNAQKAKELATIDDDVAQNIATKWKKVKKSDSLAEILGLK